MKNKTTSILKQKDTTIKYIVLIAFIALLFALLINALIIQNDKNGGEVISIGDDFMRYIVIAIMLLIPIFLIILINISLKQKFTFSGDATTVDIDFVKIDSEKKEIPNDNYTYGRLRRKQERQEQNLYEAVTFPDQPGFIRDDIIPTPEPEEKKDVVEGAAESRFCMLTNIDKAMETYVEPEYNNEISLKELCEIFRNFACSRLKLYYDITDIRRFIAGLSVTKLLILQGMSGTGKTSLPYAFGEFLRNETVIVPIQPMWKERTDLIGYYNEFTRKFNETTLLRKMYEANCNRQLYVTVLDEMNIARIEYYFAEFLSLLEIPNPDGRNLDVVSDIWPNDPKLLKDGKLRLPINMWFIGTANNDDSTFAISDKVYDRAMVLNLDKKAEPFEAPETPNLSISVDHLYDLFVKAQKEFDLSDRNLRRINKLDKYLIDTFHITFGNRIMKQIRAYVPVLVACGGTELEALDDILSRKVLRKLESKNPVYVRSQSEALCNFLDDLFGQDKMVLCKETIRNIEQNV